MESDKSCKGRPCRLCLHFSDQSQLETYHFVLMSSDLDIKNIINLSLEFRRAVGQYRIGSVLDELKGEGSKSDALQGLRNTK